MTRVEIGLRWTQGGTLQCATCLYPVVTLNGTIYIIFVATGTDVYWTKSTNGGLTWTKPTVISGGVAVVGAAVWYDRWTNAASGDLIHVAYMESTNSDVRYRNLDTSNDTMSSDVQVFNGVSVITNNAVLSMTKARGGNLLIMWDLDGGTEAGFHRSTDGGVNWTSRASANEGAMDYFIMCPGFAADNQDVFCIFWDRSANEISRKNYDDSADSWAETSIATSMTSPSANTDAPYFAIAPDLANSRVLLAAWSARDLANADLRYWTVDDATITESSTNVVLNSTDDQAMCAVTLDTVANKVYVFYFGKSDGSETVATAMNLYFKTSTDVGATWSAETQISINGPWGWNQVFVNPVCQNENFVLHMGQTNTTPGLTTRILNMKYPNAPRARSLVGMG